MSHQIHPVFTFYYLGTKKYFAALSQQFPRMIARILRKSLLRKCVYLGSQFLGTFVH